MKAEYAASRSSVLPQRERERGPSWYARGPLRTQATTFGGLGDGMGSSGESKKRNENRLCSLQRESSNERAGNRQGRRKETSSFRT